MEKFGQAVFWSSKLIDMLLEFKKRRCQTMALAVLFIVEIRS
jgi:hypothetical protein